METIVLWLLGQGAFVSFIVSLLKKITFVSQYPKIVAGLLGIVVQLAASQVFNLPTAAIDFITAIITSLVGSVAAYEMLSKPIDKAMHSVNAK